MLRYPVSRVGRVVFGKNNHQTTPNCFYALASSADGGRRLFVSIDDADGEKVSSDSSASGTTATTAIPMAGQHKNPIVGRLWAARQEAKKRLGLTESSTTEVTKACLLDQTQQKWYDSDKPKTPRESATSIDYPFSTDEFLLDSYRSPWNQIRFGKILEDLDAMAGNIAFHHVYGTPLIVTAGVDRIRLRKRPLIGADQTLSGNVTWVGNSSMEIRMVCTEKKEDGSPDEEWLEAYFTFVTLDPKTKKAIPMPPLLPETPEERAHFELGAVKANAKKQARRNKLRVGQPLTEASLKIDQLAAEWLDKAGPLLRMPSLAPSDSILMKQTELQNAMTAQPQAMNLHDRIFGGFLMRRAFELAFANCYMFGGTRPLFLEVDDISFDSPVNVGDLLVFNSRVLYTMPHGGFLGDYVANHVNQPLVMIEVEAWNTIPEQAKAQVSNRFYFTFALPEGTPCRTVLPGNIDEARRMASRMTADKEQSSLRS